jgi:hypothetical protein
MDNEEQPLLESDINYVEPVAEDQPFIAQRPSRLSATWRQANRLHSPISNLLLYPVFWLRLWLALTIQSFQGICYRSPCKICRKKAGIVDQLSASSNDGCQYCALYAQTLATMAPLIQSDLGIFTIKSEWWFKRFPLELKVWNVGGFETGVFRFMPPQGMLVLLSLIIYTHEPSKPPHLIAHH